VGVAAKRGMNGSYEESEAVREGSTLSMALVKVLDVGCGRADAHFKNMKEDRLP